MLFYEISALQGLRRTTLPTVLTMHFPLRQTVVFVITS